MSNQSPNFLIIGAAKAGTTALYFYLRQHPDIFFAPHKEPSYFAYANHPLEFAGIGDQQALRHCTTTSYEDYIAQFSQWAGETAVGEASTAYLYQPIAAPHIQRTNPNMKLIVMLRHPADRAHAAYLHLRRDGREPATDFQMGLDLEAHRIVNNWEQLWHYVSMGFYAEQVDRYLTRFPRQQMLFLLFDDFQRQPFAVLRQIYKFLGVDHSFAPDMSIQPNVSGVPRIRGVVPPAWLKRSLKPLFPYSNRRRHLLNLYGKTVEKPEMPAEIRHQLTNHFRADILQLQEMIERKLDGWLVD